MVVARFALKAHTRLSVTVCTVACITRDATTFIFSSTDAVAIAAFDALVQAFADITGGGIREVVAIIAFVCKTLVVVAFLASGAFLLA